MARRREAVGSETGSRLRELLAEGDGRPVVSLFVDLDPTRFGTLNAREAQVKSLIDEARRSAEERGDERSVEEDLKRIEGYLRSDDFPPAGAVAVALFSAGAERFEVMPLARPVSPSASIGAVPALHRLPEYEGEATWMVVLVSRRSARFFTGTPTRLRERADVSDDVHGQHSTGGWSQARYERGVEQEVAVHLDRAADVLDRIQRRENVDHVALGGPGEVRAEFERHLPENVRTSIAGSIDIDVDTAAADEVRDRLAPLAEEVAERAERELVERLAERVGRGDRAVSGLDLVRKALGELRVERVICDIGWDPPPDVVVAALEQSAGITRLRVHPIGSSDPVTALLRF